MVVIKLGYINCSSGYFMFRFSNAGWCGPVVIWLILLGMFLTDLRISPKFNLTVAQFLSVLKKLILLIKYNFCP